MSSLQWHAKMVWAFGCGFAQLAMCPSYVYCASILHDCMSINWVSLLESDTHSALHWAVPVTAHVVMPTMSALRALSIAPPFRGDRCCCSKQWDCDLACKPGPASGASFSATTQSVNVLFPLLPSRRDSLYGRCGTQRTSRKRCWRWWSGWGSTVAWEA